MKRQWTILYLDVRQPEQSTSPGTIMLQHISVGAYVKIMHDIEITDKGYEHEPETVIHNKDNNITIMLDMPVNTR